MKYYFSFILTLLVCSSLHAQTYNILNTADVKLYRNNSNVLHALFIDSVVFDKSAKPKYYYNYKQDFDDLGDLSSLNNYCKSKFINSWLGEKVQYVGSNIYIFKNKDNDVITLKTDTNAQPWKMVEYNSQKYILASVNKSLSNDTTLTIDLTAYAPINDSVFTNIYNSSKRRIIISKNLGFLKIFDFRVFPFVYSELNLCKSFTKKTWNQNLGVQSFYNFQPGDIMHYKGNRFFFNYPSEKWYFYRSIEVLEKNVNGYRIRQRDIRQYYDRSTVLENSFVVNTMNNTYTADTTQTLPYKRVKPIIYTDPKYIDRNEIYDAIVTYGIDTVFNRISRMHVISECNLSMFNTTFFQKRHFVQGIGPVNCITYGSFIDQTHTDTTLVYYKSQGIEWGDSIDFVKLHGSIQVGFQVYEDTKHLEIYPNPSSTSINLTTPNDFVKISIININGITVMNLKYNVGEIIDISELPAGVYVIKGIDVNENVFYTRFIKSEK